MSTLKPGKPSGFAEEAASSMSKGARWPRVPLSSDHDDGGVSLGTATHQGHPQGPQESKAVDTVDLNIKTPTPPPKEHSKLSATSKPFVPTGVPSNAALSVALNNEEPCFNINYDGKSNGKKFADEFAFDTQNNISDKLIHMYHERQRRATDAAVTGQFQSSNSFADHGYAGGGAPAPAPAPAHGNDAHAQHGFDQRGFMQHNAGQVHDHASGIASGYPYPRADPLGALAPGRPPVQNGHPKPAGAAQMPANQPFPGIPASRTYGVLPQLPKNLQNAVGPSSFVVPDSGNQTYHQPGGLHASGPMNGGPVDQQPANNQHYPTGLDNGENAIPPSCPPPVPRGYRAGLPGSASDGNMLGGRHVRRGHDAVAVVPYKAAQTQDPPQPTALPPLQFQPVAPEVHSQRSEVLNLLTGPKGVPDSGNLLDPFFIPFMDIWEHARPDEWGVMRIKNIPFGTTRSEVVAMVGRNSKILNDSYEPVHIIMERVTSKTLDAFVEFGSFDDAVEATEKFQRNASSGRIGRIGNRHVEVELSSQSQLMKALFPIARGIIWAGARPQIQTGSPFPWENFRSFFTEEEMTMLAKHVDCPQRAQSSYAQDCPERPYECMISTLKKIPWYMAKYITIKQRHAVYETCCKMISTLQTTLHKFPNHQRLTHQLLNRVVNAAMLCWGFTVQQKDNIALLAQMDEEKSRQFNQPRFGDLWCHMYTLGPKPGVPLDVLEYYISIIREETKRAVDSLPIGQKIALQGQSGATNGYFGYFWAEVDLPAGPAFDHMSLAEVNQRELQAIDRILRRAIEGGVPPPSYTKGGNSSSDGDGYGAPAAGPVIAYSPQFN